MHLLSRFTFFSILPLPNPKTFISNNKKGLFLYLFLFLAFSLQGQYRFFASPVKYQYKLSGNFCELRNSHFHAGIDIKASRPGATDTIFNIAAGHISRVKISSGGYGRSVWVEHPEIGYTSVYAHLESFNTPLATWIDSVQQATESYDIDICLEPHLFPVQKAAWLGIMGNTGFSFGPHLHFEIRDTKTDDFVNPFLLGFDVSDKITPTISTIVVHSLDTMGYSVDQTRWNVENYSEPVSVRSNPIPISTTQAGLTIQSTDYADGSQNTLGLYRLHLYADDSLLYSYHFDRMTQEAYRQIDGFIDYQTKLEQGRTFSLCYAHPGSNFPFCKGTGVIPVQAGKNLNIRMEAEDFCQNKKTVSLTLIGVRDSIRANYPDTTAKIWVYYDRESKLQTGNAHLTFYTHSLFRNIDFTSSVSSIPSSTEKRYLIHDPAEALKSAFRLGIIPEKVRSDKKEKAVIVLDNGGGRIQYKSHWCQDTLVANVDEFGMYYVDYDTLGPGIQPVFFQQALSYEKPLAFSIKDNFIARGSHANALKHKVWVDDCFLALPLSLKSTLEIPISNLSPGWHQLRIEATDPVGNISYFSSPFQLFTPAKWKIWKKNQALKKKRRRKKS